MSLLKDIILWKYERASPQWDVLCVLILAFIFLTPKDWFGGRENLATQNQPVAVKADDFSVGEPASNEESERLKDIQNARIVQSLDPDGNLIGEKRIR